MVQYPSAQAGVVHPRIKAVLLLSCVMSLVPMRLKNDMWNADVDFDLAAFHALVRVLKRTLRQLTEACLASVLLRDLTKAKLLPRDFMCASPKKDNHFETPAILPTFMLPRSCMGIVARFFLHYQGEGGQHFHKELQARFPCCAQAAMDLKSAFVFWDELMRCVNVIANPLGADDLLADMNQASQLLADQRRATGI